DERSGRAACFARPKPHRAKPREPDAGRAMAPLAWPVRFIGPQIGPVVTFGVIGGIFKGDAFRRRLRKVFPPRCRGKRGKRMRETGGAVRHAVQRSGGLAGNSPAAAPLRAETWLRQQ